MEMCQQREYRFNNSTLVLKFGDIVESDADVLVSSDDYSLPMEDGLALYLLEKGGPEIKVDADKMSGAELGDVVVTTAGRLPHKYIFHCVTVAPDEHFGNTAEEAQEAMRGDMEEYVIRHAIAKCFRLLAAMDLNSIAIPCIGVRRAGFSFEREGIIMSEVISEFLLRTNKVFRVELCLWNKEDRFTMMDYIAFFEQFALRVPTRDTRAVKLPAIKVVADGESAPQVAHDVFISYSHEDRETVEHICGVLDNYGISYWIDRDGVRHGDNFKEDIVKAIASSMILLFVSSANSNKSPNTIKEVGVAENYKKITLPVKIDNEPFCQSLQYDLCNRHWVQFDINDLESFGRELNDNIRFHLNRKTNNP